MNNNLKLIIIGVFISIFLGGCSIFNLGSSVSKCEEGGCNYSDAGVCSDPYYVLHHKAGARKQAYKDINKKEEDY